MTDFAFLKLDIDQIREIYYSDMVSQFPDSERRSFGNIRDMVARGIYAGYGLYENGALRAYALLALLPQHGAALLDYLAVPDEWKGKGYGSEMLERLRSEFDKTDRILIESEDPDALGGEAARTAERRLGFYARNGFKEAAVLIDLFSVRYRLYVNQDCSDTDAELLETMTGIYRTIVPPKYYDANVHLELRKEE